MKEYETSDFGGKGRKTDRKLKPFLVLQYLMKYSDDEHVVSASDLVGYFRKSEFPQNVDQSTRILKK